MLGDILLINDMHKDAAKSIGKIVRKDRKKKGRRYRYIIGISGESGSGKSELAHALGKYLKKQKIRGISLTYPSLGPRNQRTRNGIRRRSPLL